MDIYQKSIRYTANQMFRSESEALKKKTSLVLRDKISKLSVSWTISDKNVDLSKKNQPTWKMNWGSGYLNSTKYKSANNVA